MIAFFRSWCENIIIAVIISIIIETILPNGNNKKYVKVVVGIYIVFTILNPILGNLDFNDIDFNITNSVAAVQDRHNTIDIQNVYAKGIEDTLKINIEEQFGIKIKKIDIKYDKKYENIEKIDINITPQTPQITNYEKIKKYISENYNINMDNINITL